jgi:hypothetical protein
MNGDNFLIGGEDDQVLLDLDAAERESRADLEAVFTTADALVEAFKSQAEDGNEYAQEVLRQMVATKMLGGIPHAISCRFWIDTRECNCGLKI